MTTVQLWVVVVSPDGNLEGARQTQLARPLINHQKKDRVRFRKTMNGPFHRCLFVVVVVLTFVCTDAKN